ncbi:hypothetical protein [Nocardia sp. IFM 10818]
MVLPLLRAGLPESVHVGSWVDDIDYRKFPLINIRRIGGIRNPTEPTLLGLPVIEMTAYGIEGLIETEQLYEDALSVLYDAVRTQKQTPNGYLHSIWETMGATQFSSNLQDSWRIQGLIRLGLRPPRKS